MPESRCKRAYRAPTRAMSCRDGLQVEWAHGVDRFGNDLLGASRQMKTSHDAMKHLTGEPPQNKEPIIGVYDVNNFHLGDMYSKGALMLHTLRSVLADDSLFFDLLKALQTHFRYRCE